MADIYFDFSATNNGDGTTAAQAAGAGLTGAYNTTDGVSPIVDNIWWVRRSGTEKIITTSIAPVSYFAICGWPKAGDENYDDRPASGTSNGWDADGADYGELYKTNNLLYYTSTTVAVNSFYTSRMRYSGLSSIASNTLSGLLKSMQIIKCEFANRNGTASSLCIAIAGHNVHVKDCVFGGGNSTVAKTSFNYMNNGTVENCTFSFGISFQYAENCVFSDLDIILTTDISPGNTALMIDDSFNNRFENITVDNTVYTGITFPYLLTSDAVCHSNHIDLKVRGTYAHLDLDGNFNNTTITPLVSGDTPSLGSIRTLGSNKHIVLDNFVGSSFSTDSAANLVVFLDNVNVPSNNFTITNLGNGAVYSLHHGGTQGYWKAFGRKGIIESTDIYRTGGSTHSLRCMLQSANLWDDCFPCLGVRGVGETIFLDLLAGTHTITVYGAHRLFANALSKGQLYTEIDYLDSNGLQKSITSSRQGDLTTDASVWNGDTDLTVFKIEQTVTLSTDQRITVRILGNYAHETNAYFYLDPAPVVVTV